MKIEDIKKKFSESIYQDFNTINLELNNLYVGINQSIKNNYENLLFANAKKRLLKTLKPEELFLMNIHNKYILSILNISIYETLISENYEILYNGIYTYNHLRRLNRLHLEGFGFHEIIESLIFNENEYMEKNNWKEYFVKQFFDNFGDQMKGKFDIELVKVLKKAISEESGIENDFNNLLRLHSKCQWLTKGWYRECNLINYMPIFLIGIYKFIGQNLKIETENKWLLGFIDYLNKNEIVENRLVFQFSGKINFLNNTLDKGFASFNEKYNHRLRNW